MSFVTYLTIYSGDKLPPFYVGSTSLARVQSGYHGSVRSQHLRDDWDAEVHRHPYLFETRVLSEHTTREEALLMEVQIQKAFDVVRSPLFANGAYARRGFINLHPHTAATKEKIRATLRGRKATREQIDKVRAVHLGRKNSPDTIERMRQAALGRKNSDEHKAAVSAALKGRKLSDATKAQKRASTLRNRLAREN